MKTKRVCLFSFFRHKNERRSFACDICSLCTHYIVHLLIIWTLSPLISETYCWIPRSLVVWQNQETSLHAVAEENNMSDQVIRLRLVGCSSNTFCLRFRALSVTKQWCRHMCRSGLLCRGCAVSLVSCQPPSPMSKAVLFSSLLPVFGT